ncbi:hypothetical protein CFOL_v3_31918, partial [Cephalotus follicularis]
MRASRPLIIRPIKPPPPQKQLLIHTREWSPNAKMVYRCNSRSVKFPVTMTKISTSNIAVSANHSSSPVVPANKLDYIEEGIEKVIYGGRFMTLLGVLGSLIGSLLCFIKVY